MSLMRANYRESDLKGKVKSLKQEAYYAVQQSGKLEKGKRVGSEPVKRGSIRYYNYFIAYDTLGNEIEACYYNKIKKK